MQPRPKPKPRLRRLKPNLFLSRPPARAVFLFTDPFYIYTHSDNQTAKSFNNEFFLRWCTHDQMLLPNSLDWFDQSISWNKISTGLVFVERFTFQVLMAWCALPRSLWLSTKDMWLWLNQLNNDEHEKMLALSLYLTNIINHSTDFRSGIINHKVFYLWDAYTITLLKPLDTHRS
jgi:hypothetical protein